MKTIRKGSYKIKRFIGENMISPKLQSSLTIALTILFGLFTAYIDSRGGPFHLFVTGLLLTVFGAAASFIQPERVWRWALIIGGCVYIVFLTRRVFDEASLNFLKAVPTFIPAFIGVYCGAFLRRIGLMAKANNAKSN